MKYFIRSCKYLVYFLIIFFVIVGVLWILIARKQGPVGFTELFDEGALPKLAIFCLAVAAIYPALGFVKRKMNIPAPISQCRSRIVEIFEEAGYIVDAEYAGLAFRLKEKRMRLSRMFEDRIVVEGGEDSPMELEGYRKDVERLVRLLHFKLRETSEEGDEASS